MWLVSVSHSKAGEPVPTGEWVRDIPRYVIAQDIIDRVLLGRGDEGKQRGFRMNLTLCRHRVLSAAEIDGLPESWKRVPPVDIAGGPVEVMFETPDMPTTPATKPCENPGREFMDGLDPARFWIPIDCGACTPCQHRKP